MFRTSNVNLRAYYAGLILRYPPKKPAILFNERFMAARHQKWCDEIYVVYILVCFLVCNGISKDDVGVARGAVFQKIRPGVGFKTGDFVKEKLGGYRKTTLGWGQLPGVDGGSTLVSAYRLQSIRRVLAIASAKCNLACWQLDHNTAFFMPMSRRKCALRRHPDSKRSTKTEFQW